VPVINKVDLPSANIEETKRQLEEILAIPGDTAVLASAKSGIGIQDILDAVIERIPCPSVPAEESLQALVFDSVFDTYRGVVTYVRLFSGAVEPGMMIQMMSTGQKFEVKEVGVFTPMRPEPRKKLRTGDVGYLIANIKSTADVNIGDTVTDARRPAAKPLPGFQQVHPMVFSGIYPVNSADYEHLKAAMAKLNINDSAFHYTAESSAALGFGFRCGFLGLLHLEIVQERLRRQFDMDIIATYPSVIYRVLKTDGSIVDVDNPAFLPDLSVVDHIEEPYVKAFVICPNGNIGDMLQLIMEKRGDVLKTDSIDTHRVMLTARIPLNEILVDFHDKIKSITRGYGSLDYEHEGYREGDLIKLDILVNGEPVDAFSSIAHRSKAEARGRALALKLKEVIPQQMFQIAIQAAIGGKIIARETVKALSKNVTAKCYGGDITRKRKLWEKQKEGKKRMKQIGKVNIPQEAFISVLKAG
jgi:GTP-binding protein LepA